MCDLLPGDVFNVSTNTALCIFISSLKNILAPNQAPTTVQTAGYGTCHHMLNTGVGLTAACTVVGAWFGASMFFKDDMNIHKAVFVDTLNTSPGKRSHTTWGSNTSGNWGSITVNRTYIKKGIKCSEYESVIDITRQWPLYGVMRNNEFGTACQMPDGRWYIQ